MGLMGGSTNRELVMKVGCIVRKRKEEEVVYFFLFYFSGMHLFVLVSLWQVTS